MERKGGHRKTGAGRRGARRCPERKEAGRTKEGRRGGAGRQGAGRRDRERKGGVQEWRQAAGWQAELWKGLGWGGPWLVQPHCDSALRALWPPAGNLESVGLRVALRGPKAFLHAGPPPHPCSHPAQLTPWPHPPTPAVF